MPYSEDELRGAHTHCFKNRVEVEASEICGCFYCCKTSRPCEVTKWVDCGETAMCPRCQIDTLLGSASNLPVMNEEFLRAMNEFWFRVHHNLRVRNRRTTG